MMRNLKLNLLIIMGLLFTVSCELDRFPETNLSDSNFWKNEENFKQACNVFYLYVDGEQEIRLDNNRSDFSVNPRAFNAISSGTRIVPAQSGDWNKAYRAIFNANNIINKAIGKEDIASIDRWVGEAKFWRAYAYFDLVSKFGDVPLVLSPLDINSPQLTEPRTERQLVINQIYDDLDFSAANLPNFEELGSAGYGRVSRSAALALKARVALYEGTRQKFHNYGDFSSNLSVAVDAASEAMAEGHVLNTEMPYLDLFTYSGEGYANKENILSAIYGVDQNNQIRSHRLPQLLQNYYGCITRPMVELYLCTDGLPYDKSPLAEIPEKDFMSIFKNKDPRMDASIYKPGDPYGFASYEDVPTGDNATGFTGRKYDILGEGDKSCFVDFAIIRYAEVLLIYAEAKFELNENISDSDLDKSINLLRDRVSMPHLTNAFVDANGLDMRTEIRRERSVELAQEGFRYNDINRWKIAEIVLPKAMVGAVYFPEYGPRRVSEDGYLLAQFASDRYFDPEKDYLYPIPVREIALSEGAITQNPGWE
jgi:hypothetical protein